MKIRYSPSTRQLVLPFLFLLATLVLPANREAMALYHLSSLQYHELLFIITVPFIGIWVAAYFGYSRMRSYANTIKLTKEGGEFNNMSRGIGWLALAFVVPEVLAFAFSIISNNVSSFRIPAIIIVNYVYLLLPLVAYVLLSNSAGSLNNHFQIKKSFLNEKSAIFAVVLLGVIFCYLTFRNIGLASLTETNNAYHLPVWLVIITIVIPYLFSWCIGLLAAYNILIYAKYSKGLLYRRGLQYVGIGIAIVVVSSITTQYITSVGPRDGHLSLNFSIAAIYLLRIIAATGYVSIAVGASRLKKIEDI